MKVAYIIPGLDQSSRSKPYRELANFFRGNNFQPVPVQISWKYKTMTHYLKQFYQHSQNQPRQETCMLGFSFGAMIAFLSASFVNPRALILCSLSPYFKEDLPHIPQVWKTYMGIRKITDMKKYSFNAYAQEIKSKTFIVVGDKEYPLTKKRAAEASKKISGSRLLTIRGAEHNIAQKEYLKTLEELIAEL